MQAKSTSQEGNTLIQRVSVFASWQSSRKLVVGNSKWGLPLQRSTPLVRIPTPLARMLISIDNDLCTNYRACSDLPNPLYRTVESALYCKVALRKLIARGTSLSNFIRYTNLVNHENSMWLTQSPQRKPHKIAHVYSPRDSWSKLVDVCINRVSTLYTDLATLVSPTSWGKL